MAGPDVVERVIRAALKQGGELLELASDRPTVLVRAGERLRAGGLALDQGTLEAWWQQIAGAEAPGGGPVRVTRGEHAITVTAERPASGVLRVNVRLGGDTPGQGQPPLAEGAPSPAPAPAPGSNGRPLDRLLREMVELDASDLHLSSTVAPMFRLHGEMIPVAGTTALSSEQVMLMCDDIAPAKNRREFREVNDTDFAYEIEGVARFRVNMFRDRKGVGAVFRQIPTEIRSMEELGLPQCVRELCNLTKGLVVVTGPTGSGKSTTLAAMVDHINETRSDHIITIEDPIEFVHSNKRCLINQREVFTHTGSFKHALRAALREDPDIVLVGEMRDLETIAIAIETAETGHLVFGTLHTTTAVATVDRIIDQFPADRQAQIRIMMSDALKGVISQTLCRRREGGRVAAFEILLGIPAVSNLIREGKTHQIASTMQTGKKHGMRTLNDALAELVIKRIIDTEEANLRAIDKEGLKLLLRAESGAAAG